jgi:UPF0716 protein FxsA
MFLILFLIFIITPIIEIALFIQVGGVIGAWPTLAIVVLTALLGSVLLRAQGLSIVARTRRSLDAGELPVEPVIDAFALVIAGALLLTPGFLTDAVGFALFVPPLRRIVARWIFNRMVASGRLRVFGASQSARPGPGHDRGAPRPGAGAQKRDQSAEVIDVAFEPVEEPKGETQNRAAADSGQKPAPQEPAGQKPAPQEPVTPPGKQKPAQTDQPGSSPDDSPWRR